MNKPTGTVQRWSFNEFGDELIETNHGAWVESEDYDALAAQAVALATALKKLANEASGFEAMSSDAHHGHTNKRVLRERIEEARTVLQQAQAILNAQGGKP